MLILPLIINNIFCLLQYFWSFGVKFVLLRLRKKHEKSWFFFIAIKVLEKNNNLSICVYDIFVFVFVKFKFNFHTNGVIFFFHTLDAFIIQLSFNKYLSNFIFFVVVVILDCFFFFFYWKISFNHESTNNESFCLKSHQVEQKLVASQFEILIS